MDHRRFPIFDSTPSSKSHKLDRDVNDHYLCYVLLPRGHMVNIININNMNRQPPRQCPDCMETSCRRKWYHRGRAKFSDGSSCCMTFSAPKWSHRLPTCLVWWVGLWERIKKVGKRESLDGKCILWTWKLIYLFNLSFSWDFFLFLSNARVSRIWS